MPKVEIDESELLNQQTVVKAVNSMLANPEARKLLLKARKTADRMASTLGLTPAQADGLATELALGIDDLRGWRVPGAD